MTRKKMEVPNLLRRYGTTWNRYVLPLTPGVNKGTTQVWKLAARCEEVKTRVQHQPRRLRPHFGVSFEKGSHTRRQNQWTSILERQQKTRKKIQGLSLLSYSSWHVSSCSANAVDLAFILSSFLHQSIFHMLDHKNLLSRPSIEINTIWEPVIKSAREKQ